MSIQNRFQCSSECRASEAHRYLWRIGARASLLAAPTAFVAAALRFPGARSVVCV